MSSATFYVGDALKVLATLPENSVDLVLTSPPFLALRSYLPADHPDKALEGGSQATPGAYIDWLLDVVEACDRVLAPHGSLCFELGDTYAGSGGAGGDYSADGLRAGQPAFTGSGRLANYNDARGNPDGMRDTTFSGGNTRTGGGTGWALAKSLSLIPESFRFAMVYGFNPFTGRQTERWRLRNVIRWVRPNPPVGALGDKFRPATSELMVFCKSARRYFDLDAVRSPHIDGRLSSGGGSAISNGIPRGARGDLQSNPAGAPPLDWWNIPPGGYVSFPEAVNPGEFSGGILYIASEGCSLHEGHPDLAATEPHGGRVEIRSPRNPDTGGGHVQGQLLDSAPTDQPTEPNPEGDSSDSPHPESPPVAKRRSKASSKTAPAPATTTPDNASDRSPDRTGDTQDEPQSDELHPGSPESRSGEVGLVALALETYARTGHKPAELEGCSCSFFVASDSTSHYAVKPEKRITSKAPSGISKGSTQGERQTWRTEGGAPPLDWWEIAPGGFSGAHYAVWPPELLIKPIKAMCPEQVCRTCGEARRRIVGEAEYTPSATYRGGSSFAESERLGEGVNQWNGAGGALGSVVRNAPTLGFTDCGHNDWRPGVVLDPFVGSGTTLAVASGHGRDSIGVDLDERNYDLALQRVGPLVLQRGEVAA